MVLDGYCKALCEWCNNVVLNVSTVSEYASSIFLYVHVVNHFNDFISTAKNGKIYSTEQINTRLEQ